MRTLLTTVHGSHLYGLATQESDLDLYRVVDAPAGRARHRVRDGLDTTVVPLGTSVQQCSDGVPQALEALFSPLADRGPLDSYRAAYRVGSDAMASRYLRTIRAFALEDRYPPESRNSFKRRRHAFRLALNLDQALRHGRFNPTLSEEQAERCTTSVTDPNYLLLLSQACPFDPGLV